MLVLAVRRFIQTRGFLRDSVIAHGTVVALIENWDGQDLYYHPQVSFRTAEGREVTFESAVGSSVSSRQVGDILRVRYRPRKPQTAEIDAFSPLWLAVLVFGVLAATFLLVGVGICSGFLSIR